MVDGSKARQPGWRVPAGTLRDQLTAASALVGAPLTVTDEDAWRVSRRGITVGLGWFAARGHTDAEARSLALLELWQHVRFPRVDVDRARRCRSIVRERPELVALVDVILRLQAAAELFTVMPGMHDSLTAAALRSLPQSLLEWPRHLQWVGLLLHSGLTRHTGLGWDRVLPCEVDPAVAHEWQVLHDLAPDGLDPLRRAMIPDRTRSPLRRFERALALVMPSFDRLRELDLEERGLGDHDGASMGRDSAPERHTDTGPEALTSSGPDDGADASGPTEASSSETSETPPEGTQERARAGDGNDRAEGADLFAAEQAGFVQRMLPTPMPSTGAALLEAYDLPRDARAESGTPGTAQLAAAGGHGSAPPRRGYQERVEALRPAIDRMREVWARVITERVGLRRAPGRRASESGDDLHSESLAGAVAEAMSGVARPTAFQQPRIRPRRSRRAGSTDYVLLVDRSASMQGVPASAAADAALVMLEALAAVARDVAHAESHFGVELELDIRTALVVFNTQAVVVKPLSRGLDDQVRRAMVTEIRSPHGSTNDGSALREAARQLGIGLPADARGLGHPNQDGVERRRIVIFVGDGGSNDPVAAAHELQRLRRAGVQIWGIGIGSDEIVRRFAPTSRRLNDPRALPEILTELIAGDLE